MLFRRSTPADGARRLPATGRTILYRAAAAGLCGLFLSGTGGKLAGGPHAAAGSPRGTLMLIGGGLPEVALADLQKTDRLGDPAYCDPCGMLRVMLGLAASRHPVVECITCADEDDPQRLGEQHKVLIRALGAAEVGYIAARDRNDVEKDASIVERIRRADVVMLCGGDQSLLNSRFGATAACRVLRERYLNDDGFVLVGNSAGAMILADQMITGDAAKPEQAPPLKPGWSLLHCTIDTHVGPKRRRRLGRAVTKFARIGLGISTQSALVLKHGRGEVYGGQVILIRRANETAAARPAEESRNPALDGCEEYTRNGLVAKCYAEGQSLDLNELAETPAP